MLSHPKYVAHTLRSLGIDPTEGQYIFDGKTLHIDGINAADIKAAEASLCIAALDAEEKLRELHAQRAEAYPPQADYLDAIVKGDAVAQQAYIDACLAIKAKYPKPV